MARVFARACKDYVWRITEAGSGKRFHSAHSRSAERVAKGISGEHQLGGEHDLKISGILVAQKRANKRSLQRRAPGGILKSRNSEREEKKDARKENRPAATGQQLLFTNPRYCLRPLYRWKAALSQRTKRWTEEKIHFAILMEDL